MTVVSNKRVARMLDAVSAASGSSSVLTLGCPSDGPKTLAFQFVFGGAGSVDIMGRLSPEAPWVTLATGAVTIIFELLAYVPEIRLDWTGNDSTIDAWVMY